MRDLFLCVVVAVGAVQCKSFDAGSDVKLVDAEVSFENPEVGYLAYSSSPNDYFCTGTLVREDLVLTAAHCAFNPYVNEGYFSGPVHGTFVFVIQAGIGRSSKYSVQKMLSFARTSGESDLALLTLEGNVPGSVAQPASIAAMHPDADTPIKWFGYGCTGHVYDATGDTMVSNQESGIKRVVKQRFGDHRYQGCKGDSGGPIMDAATREIYAVASTEDTRDGSGTVSDDFRRTHDNSDHGGDWGGFADVAGHYEELSVIISKKLGKKY